MITIIVLWILLGIIAVIVILLHFSITAQIDLNKKGFDLKVRSVRYSMPETLVNRWLEDYGEEKTEKIKKS